MKRVDLGTNREAWLQAATAQLCEMMQEAYGATLSASGVRVSVGFPANGALRNRNRTIGQCWSGQCATDGLPQVFLHPQLISGVEVLGVLLHELIHADVGTACGHKGPFKQAMIAVGLGGKPTATVVDAGSALETQLLVILAEIGEYPHAALDASRAIRKKQSTRLLKVECRGCGYVIRVTKKWADVGLPTCCCGSGMYECGAQ